MTFTDVEISRQEDFVNVLKFEFEKVCDEYSEAQNKLVEMREKYLRERKFLGEMRERPSSV